MAKKTKRTYNVAIVLQREYSVDIDNAKDNEFEGTPAEMLAAQMRSELEYGIEEGWLAGKVIKVLVALDPPALPAGDTRETPVTIEGLPLFAATK